MDVIYFDTIQLDVLAVGFKIFYWHCEEGIWKSVWNYLKYMNELKIIHISRKNILKTLLSLKRAKRNKEWSTTKVHKAQMQEPIELKYSDCVKAFTEWPQKKISFEDYFKKKDTYNISYEELCSSYEQHSEKLQEFLGLTPINLKPTTIKQNRQTLC